MVGKQQTVQRQDLVGLSNLCHLTLRMTLYFVMRHRKWLCTLNNRNGISVTVENFSTDHCRRGQMTSKNEIAFRLYFTYWSNISSYLDDRSNKCWKRWLFLISREIIAKKREEKKKMFVYQPALSRRRRNASINRKSLLTWSNQWQSLLLGPLQ